MHQSKKCLVTQRQVGLHTRSFKHALRAALREDPDIILVGEMRDLETVSIAIETAETGHLVFGTLHTTTAASTIDRIIDQFPADRQSQVRVMLSESLRGVIAQTLCKKIGGGRVAAREILLSIPAVSNLIREGKTFQIPSIMQTNRKTGMVTLNDALMELVDGKQVEPKEAYMKAVEKAGFAGGAQGQAARYVAFWARGDGRLDAVPDPGPGQSAGHRQHRQRGADREELRDRAHAAGEPGDLRSLADRRHRPQHRRLRGADRDRGLAGGRAWPTACYVAVLTARGRTAKRRTLRPREAAAELVEQAADGAGGDRGRARRTAASPTPSWIWATCW